MVSGNDGHKKSIKICEACHSVDHITDVSLMLIGRAQSCFPNVGVNSLHDHDQ